jgi:hypothetical protein
MRDQVDAVAARQNCNTSDVIRLAIEQFVTGAKRADDSRLRHMRLTECAQIALNAIIRENHPELRDHLIANSAFGWRSIMACDDPKGMRRDIRNDGRHIPQEHHSARGDLPRNSGNFTRGSQLLNTQVLMCWRRPSCQS